MSSEFERLLREARRALPEPSDVVTRRARERAIAAVRRRRSLRRPAAAILAVSLVGLGVGIGALIAPSGSAAPEPLGLGFLPERGWSVLQNGGDGTPAWPTTAVAANVELSPDDDAEGLPLSTLKALPPQGVVIVATFIARGAYYGKFPPRKLPLKVSGAAPFIDYGVQVRPGRPLGQYQLKAAVNRHNVDVQIYFGTERPTPALFTAAQQQLDRLIVRPEPEPTPTISPRSAAAVSVDPTRIVDRTLVCSTVAVVYRGRFVRVGMTSPKSLATLETPGRASVVTGSAGESEVLTGIKAGAEYGTPGGAYYNKSRCRVTAKRVPLTARGLPGPPVAFDQSLECTAGARVLVRVRAVLDRKAVWRASKDILTANGNISTAALAVRTEAGKPLSFFTLASGKTRLWTAGSCTR